jgi:glycosyltransferase involved in cell wall biosynthesis
MRLSLVTETYPPEVNGVARTLHHLVTGLTGLGHEVEVVRSRPARTAECAQSNGHVERIVPGLPLPGYPELRFGLPSGGRLRRMWRESRPDVIHVATEGPLGWTAVGAARRLGIPVSSSFHTNFHSYGKHYRYGFLRGFALRYLRRAHNRADCTLVPSSTIRRRLEAAGFRNLAILGRGVDTELFSPARRDEGLRESWGASAGTPVVLYVGRLAGEKNIPLLFRAWDALREHASRPRLVLVGDGPARRELERSHPEAHYAGMRHGEDLARHYASGDLFLFPSATETFGNVVTEAMASGLGVLGFDYAAAEEHVRHGENGWKVPYGDEGAYVAAALDVLGVREGWPAVREAARRTAEGLTWRAIVRGFERGLLALSSGEGRPA